MPTALAILLDGAILGMAVTVQVGAYDDVAICRSVIRAEVLNNCILLVSSVDK